MPDDLSLRQPVHFLKIDVEGFEMEVIDSAAKLMDLQLVENIIAEFGPVGVWGNSKLDLATTRTNWKKGLKKMIRHYGFDIRILDGPGFQALVDLMQRERVNIDPESPGGKVKINRLFARDFFGNTFQPGDAFSEKMKAAQYHISDYVDLPFEFIDTFLDQNDNIAQLYLWFTRRESPMVQNFFSE
ncbi:hypothetical protein BC940DRAFT_357183 [Gongronella butleri]|nr:hypothetical protein BC940DRAFT_357183 [Gongronella butleri]